MESVIDKSGLDDRLFNLISDNFRNRYVFMLNLKTNVGRFSGNAVEDIGLPGEYVENPEAVWLSIVHPDDREMYCNDIKELYLGKKESHSLEYRIKDKHGDYLVITCKAKILCDENGKPELFAGTMLNHGISEHIDSVTGLYNVYAFLQDIHKLQNINEAASVLIVGVNRFSDVNRMYGYECGNRVLKEFGQKLRAILGEADNMYRMDGIKFALVLKSKSVVDIKNIFSHIKLIAHNGFAIGDSHVSFTVSGGVVQMEGKGINEYSVQASLGYVLDVSKYQKHGDLVIFNDSMIDKEKRNLEVIDAIRDSVLHDMKGFYLCYQPIIDVKTDSVSGMEALCRWNQEPYGEVPPGIFIPWLESDPCFYELGKWIMRQALWDGKKILANHPDFVVNVNVSVAQIEREGFRESVQEILKELEFPPQNLCIELTERCVSLDKDFLRGELEYFRSLGIKIALDDFGTGVSSLGLLLDIPADYLKIDRNFVTEISSNRAEQVLVETIALCAEGMEIDVCVEGVETEEMKEFLKRYRIRAHQGYYYSKPVRIEKFIDFLECG